MLALWGGGGFFVQSVGPGPGVYKFDMPETNTVLFNALEKTI